MKGKIDIDGKTRRNAENKQTFLILQKTPGFSLQHLQYLVIDEADRVMEDVQNDWLTHVEKAVYSGSRAAPGPINCYTATKMDLPLQKLLFSATLSQNPEKLQELSLYEPKLFTSAASNMNAQGDKDDDGDDHDFVGKFTTPAELTETILKVDNSMQKPLLLANLIKQRKMRKALIFTNSIESAHQLTLVLKQLGLLVAEISSSVKSKRSKIINMFKSDANKINVLVSTDALARGIDIGTIDFVISYDNPKYVKTYIHRIGRTARAGKPGVAITLLEAKQLKAFKNMLSQAKKSTSLTYEKIDISANDVKDYEKALAQIKVTEHQ